MKCPYCEREMQKGYIPTDNIPAQWLPNEKRQSLFKLKYSKDCKKIVSENTAFGMHAIAYYCGDCGIILLNEER